VSWHGLEQAQALKDLERLALVRKKRDAEAKKKAEEEARGEAWVYLPHDQCVPHPGPSHAQADVRLCVPPAAKAEEEARAKRMAEEAAASAGESAYVLGGHGSMRDPGGVERGGVAVADVEKLDPREIKKMNGKQLKDYLKERGLSTQGQKKELVDRCVPLRSTTLSPRCQCSRVRRGGLMTCVVTDCFTG
jgi:hypothetical protein